MNVENTIPIGTCEYIIGGPSDEVTEFDEVSSPVFNLGTLSALTTDYAAQGCGSDKAVPFPAYGDLKSLLTSATIVPPNLFTSEEMDTVEPPLTHSTPKDGSTLIFSPQGSISCPESSAQHKSLCFVEMTSDSPTSDSPTADQNHLSMTANTPEMKELSAEGIGCTELLQSSPVAFMSRAYIDIPHEYLIPSSECQHAKLEEVIRTDALWKCRKPPSWTKSDESRKPEVTHVTSTTQQSLKLIEASLPPEIQITDQSSPHPSCQSKMYSAFPEKPPSPVKSEAIFALEEPTYIIGCHPDWTITSTELNARMNMQNWIQRLMALVSAFAGCLGVGIVIDLLFMKTPLLSALIAGLVGSMAGLGATVAKSQHPNNQLYPLILISAATGLLSSILFVVIGVELIFLTASTECHAPGKELSRLDCNVGWITQVALVLFLPLLSLISFFIIWSIYRVSDVLEAGLEPVEPFLTKPGKMRRRCTMSEQDSFTCNDEHPEGHKLANEMVFPRPG